jgi:FdhD protein
MTQEPAVQERRDPATPGAVVRRPVTATKVLAVSTDEVRTRPDRLVTEEPLEIRVHGPGEQPVPLAVTMRTPGHDFELAAGFCLTEGVITAASDIATIGYCRTAGDDADAEQRFNVVTVHVRHPIVAGIAGRRFLATSACGVCGKAAIDDLAVRCGAVRPGPVVPASTIRTLPERLAEHQRLFGETGGLHAAARFDPSGTLVTVREDVGRHNALDKLVGRGALDGALPLSDEVLLVSGRLSFELVQKAAVAGIPVLCAVSAPSSLAVATAERFGQTVVAFLRDDRFNVYTGAERVDTRA